MACTPIAVTKCVFPVPDSPTNTFMLDIAKQRGYTSFKLNAQAHLREFYGVHGFAVSGPNFIEADIDHCPMSLEL